MRETSACAKAEQDALAERDYLADLAYEVLNGMVYPASVFAKASELVDAAVRFGASDRHLVRTRPDSVEGRLAAQSLAQVVCRRLLALQEAQS